MKSFSGRRWLCTLTASASGLLGITGAASAASFTVNSTSDAALATSSSTSCDSTLGAGSCTLRAAVQAADNTGAASTISLPAGDYKLTIASAAAADPTTGDLDVDNNAAITITGAGSGSTAVDANGIDRALSVQSGAGLTLSAMTFKNGHPASGSSGSLDGGAIYSDGTLAIAGDVTFAHNSAALNDGGGAIYADNGVGSTLSITGATFFKNNGYQGGAVYDNAPGSVSISASTFTANTASDEDGGAIYANNGPLTITASQFNSNAAYSGAGIYYEGHTALTITGSSFTANAAYHGGSVTDDSSTSTTLTNDRFSGGSGYEGGALYLDSGPGTVYTLNQDEFDGNTATDYGAAVAWDYGSLSSTGSSFVDNSGTDAFGGALYANSGGALSLINATMTGNSAIKGGGIYFDASTPTSLTNDTITANTSGSGAGGIYGVADATIASSSGVQNTIIANNPGGDCNTTFSAAGLDAGHNLDGDLSCFGGLSGVGDQTGVNPLLGPAGDNGGSVQTEALLAGSPAIDTGSNTNCPATDARGVPRPQGSACDIGAYELAASGLSLTKTAPATATVANPYNYTLTTTSTGPGPASQTILTDRLPAGMTLYGSTPSQGACTSGGSPAVITCDLGALDSGSTATVSLVIAEANPGPVTNTAIVTDDQGATATASATTQVDAASTPTTATAPTATSAPIAMLTRTAAVLTGQVSTGGQSTTYFFQYGTSSSYGQATPVNTTTTNQIVTATITGLRPRTQYHYRLVASNSSGLAYGADRSFTTPTATARVSLHVKSSTHRHQYRYTFAGRLGLPAGVNPSNGCSGTITIAIKQGTRIIASHRTRVSHRCTYTTTFKLAHKPPHHAKLTASARYNGDTTLTPSRSRPIKLHHR